MIFEVSQKEQNKKLVARQRGPISKFGEHTTIPKQWK
jgi:hypothetical protein